MENKEKRKAYRQAHRADIKVYNQTYHKDHREQANARRRVYHPVYWANLRADALRILGSKCACPGCDESEPLFLTVDHIQGRSKKRRQPLVDAKASGWDKTKFQTLCFNCNCAKKDRGFCPVHQKDTGASNGHRPSTIAQLRFEGLEGR